MLRSATTITALHFVLWAVLKLAQSLMRDLVPSIMSHQQPGSHHLFRRLHAANRAIAAGVIEPAGSADEASV
jgi:hypothetical protein